MPVAMTSIMEWLESIGLSEYAQRFVENGVDFSVVRELTDQDLKDLGVLLGHRRKILRATAQLDDPATPSAKTAIEPSRPTEAERRHLSVMFCDLVGSTALASQLDPEDMRNLIAAYHSCIAEVVRGHQGKIARYMGDGVLVYFGYPQAHEDDAERAVRAALALVVVIANLRDAVAPLQVRVGIATGTVVVSELMIERTLVEQAVVGDTPNLAARLQAMAEPGTVLICANTRHLTRGEFHYHDLPPVLLKGWVEPVRAYQVLRMSGAESRFDALHAAQLPEMFGRGEEIELLLRRWRQAVEEEGRVVTLTGEPGIGKSHIALALNERLLSEPHTTLRYFCSEHHTQSALFPFINQIERAARFEHNDSPDEKFSKLKLLLTQSTQDPEHVSILADLLSLPTDGRYRPEDLTPQKRKEKVFAALLAQLGGLAAREPVLLIFEDAHWIDPTSLELLAATVEHAPQLRVLLLITSRPEFTPPWPRYPHTTTIALSRLSRRDGTALISRVTGGRTLPKEVMEHILAHTDGVPLFVEELTKMVLEGGLLRQSGEEFVLDGPLPSLAIPTTLQASLMARLDRLSPLRDVAQIAAVAGREFHYELVSAVAGLPKQQLDEALDQLVRSELMFRRGEIPHAVYTFKHALVRDAAYEGLLKSRRVQLHEGIGKAIERQFPEVLQSQPEIVAYHYTQARNYNKALQYWYEAGRKSAARSAHREAIGHLRQGLNQIPHIEDAALRNKYELLLQTSLGNALRAVEGWSTDGVKQAYTRALQLCKVSGLDQHLLPAMFGLWTWNFVHESLEEAQALAEKLLHSAQGVDDAVCKVLAHEALGFTLFAQGKFVAAHSELERCIRFCEDSKAGAYLELSAQDPRVHVRTYDGMTLWMLGYPDRALRICAEARRYADSSKHPFSQAIAQTISLRVHQLRGDVAAVLDQGDAAAAFCAEHGFVHYQGMALVLRGWATACQTEFEKGISDIQHGLSIVRAAGALLFESYSLTLLADACLKNQRYELALDFLRRAQVGHNKENSARFYAAETYRLLGEAYLRSNPELDEAEHYLLEALKLAREQQAKSFELRVCLSIVDLYQCRKTAEKRGTFFSQLQETYARFDEGFDTLDLVQARTKLRAV